MRSARQGGEIDVGPVLIRFENRAEQRTASTVWRLVSSTGATSATRNSASTGLTITPRVDAGDEKLERPVQQRRVMNHVRGNADRIERIERGIIVGSAALRDHEHAAVGRHARSIARLVLSRPTKIGATICGNTTRSRIGTIGIPAAVGSDAGSCRQRQPDAGSGWLA